MTTGRTKERGICEICLKCMRERLSDKMGITGPVFNSSRGGGGRHLGWGTKILHTQGEGE